MALQWQRLELGVAIGDPGPLPAELRGVAASELADLAWRGPAWEGVAYVPVPPPAPAPARRWVSQADFKRRLTAPERIAIRAARSADPVVDDFVDILDSAPDVDLDDADLIAGLAYLVGLELLAEGRPAEIRA